MSQVLTDTHGCALLPRPFTDARPVRIADFFTDHPASMVTVIRDGRSYVLPLVDVPAGHLWGVEFVHVEGDPSLAAYYWNNEVGFLFFAYDNYQTARKLADYYLLRQEEKAA